MKKSETGRKGEQIAQKFLKSKGFRILETNFRRPWGELDIVAERAGVVHVVEVKSSAISRENISRENQYDPLEHADQRKLLKVMRTAQTYMAARHDDRPFQIDVMAVYLDFGQKTARCHHFEQVVE